MLLPIYLLVGVLNILANSQNFNINPNRNPKMDIRVRRQVDFETNSFENTVGNTLRRLTRPEDWKLDPVEPYVDDNKVVNAVVKSTEVGIKDYLSQLSQYSSIEKYRTRRSYQNDNNNNIKTNSQNNNNIQNSYYQNNYNMTNIHNGYNQNNNNMNNIHNGYNQNNNNMNNIRNGYYQNNNNETGYNNQYNRTQPYRMIKYNHGVYYVYPNNSNNISPYNFTNYNNQKGYYPNFQPNNNQNNNATNLQRNNFHSNVNITNGKLNRYNVTTVRYNGTVVTTSKPRIDKVCVLGCNIGCPAFFRKIGIYCLPEEEIDE